MKPPTRVKVGELDYDVVVSRARAADAQVSDGGVTFPESTTIVLAPDVSPSQLRDKVMHEILHAVIAQSPLGAHEGSLQGTTFSAEFEEYVVRVLSPAVLALLRRNPRLVAYLVAP